MKIPVPGRPGDFIRTVSYGEHHMGAETIEFRLSFELEGKRALFTTNGRVLPGRDRRSVYLHDATMVVRIDCETLRASHYRPPRGSYLAGFAEHASRFEVKTRAAAGEVQTKWFDRETMPFEVGLGPASDGLFPSAYAPVVERILAGDPAYQED